MHKLTTYLKLFGIIAVAFGMSIVLNKEIFLANTPRIRQNLGQYLVARVSNLGNIFNLNNLTAKKITPKTQAQIDAELKKNAEELKKMAFTSVAKGVNARSYKTHSETVFFVDQIEWIEHTYVVNGKTIKIKVPKGMDPPSQNVMNDMYSDK